MNVLVVGSGAREHVLAWAVQNAGGNVYAFMTHVNPGIKAISHESVVASLEPRAIAQYAKEKKIEMVVVGPEAPLAEGLSDELSRYGIPCVGPTREAARLEWDKGFARRFMETYRIPGLPRYKIFSKGDEKNIDRWIDELGGEVAVKPAGLTGGKGVKVTGIQLKDGQEAKMYAREVLSHDVGKLGKVVIEEKLVGEEFTVMAFVDGTRIAPFPAVQDHKTAYEGDTGPNTGGMGSYSDAGPLLPFMEKRDYEDACEIMSTVVTRLSEEGIVYRGFLYGQFMATRDGVMLVEFNVRLGDPEAMNVLPLLRTNILDVFQQIVSGNLKAVSFEPRATVVKYLVPEGYPESPQANLPIRINFSRLHPEAQLFYANVYEKEGTLYTGTSRALAIFASDHTIEKAEEKVALSMRACEGPLRYRKDIGTRQLIQKRIDHMKRLRSAV